MHVPTGSKIDVLTWELASTSVTDQIALLITMSDYRQSLVALSLRATLSLADAMVLVRRLGHTRAVAFIDVVDPWCYPKEKTRAPSVFLAFYSALWISLRMRAS